MLFFPVSVCAGYRYLFCAGFLRIFPGFLCYSPLLLPFFQQLVYGNSKQMKGYLHLLIFPFRSQRNPMKQPAYDTLSLCLFPAPSALTADALYLTGQNSTRRIASKRRPSRIPRMISINLRISHKICNIFSPVFYIFSCCEGSRFPVHFIDQTSSPSPGLPLCPSPFL